MFSSLLPGIEFCLTIFAIWTFLHWYTQNNLNDESFFNIYVHLYDFILMVFRRDTFLNLHRRKFKEGRRYTRFIGLYHFRTPVLMIRDPELIKQIMIKDYNLFIYEHEFVPRGLDDFWDAKISSLLGSHHNRMRALISPTFKKFQINAIFKYLNATILNCLENFDVTDDKQTFEAKDTFQRIGSDVLAHCMLEIELDSIQDKDNEFYTKGKQLSLIRTERSGWMQSLGDKHLGKLLRVRGWHQDSTNYFHALIKDIMQTRTRKVTKRGDLLDCIIPEQFVYNQEDSKRKEEKIKVREKLTKEVGYAVPEEFPNNFKEEKGTLNDFDIAAQFLFFYQATRENVSIALSFLCYELARHAGIQKKLWAEIDNVLADYINLKDITYETICDMQYLDMVVSESLRKWPPIIFLQRQACQDYIIPTTLATLDDYPFEKETTVKRGSTIIIPIFALHRCEEFFKYPDEFIPSRFDKSNIHLIKDFTYMPFGTGRRNCLGARFALMQIKVTIFHLLAKYRLFLTKETRLCLAKGVPRLDLSDGMLLGLERRN